MFESGWLTRTPGTATAASLSVHETESTLPLASIPFAVRCVALFLARFATDAMAPRNAQMMPMKSPLARAVGILAASKLNDGRPGTPPRRLSRSS